MSLEPSRDLVLKKLHDCFPDPHTEADALAALGVYGRESWHRERDRVHLAILKQCEGNLERLRGLVHLADRDYRDALVGAEFLGEIQASSKATQEELAAIRRRDREQYERWLRSDGP